MARAKTRDLNKVEVDRHLIRRFWGKADKREDGCWEWQSAKMPKGYGIFTVLLEGKYVGVLAHRMAWLITYSDVPTELYVCHKCDNPKCVRPEHLFLGTHADNLGDQKAKGRSRFGSKHHGAKVTEEDVKDMFALREQGLTHKQIAEKYNMSRPNVTVILNGRTWQNVDHGKDKVS